MKKSRFIATILTVTMAFSVTACSSNSEKGEESFNQYINRSRVNNRSNN